MAGWLGSLVVLRLAHTDRPQRLPALVPVPAGVLGGERATLSPIAQEKVQSNREVGEDVVRAWMVRERQETAQARQPDPPQLLDDFVATGKPADVSRERVGVTPLRRVPLSRPETIPADRV